MKEEQINILDEISKGACMGVDAINFLIEKVENQDFISILSKQRESYQNTINEVANLYESYSNEKPHKTNVMNKAMTYYGIEMQTITDKSDSKLAELLIKGTNMGIIEGIKIQNNKNISEKIKPLVDDFVSMQEKYLEKLKKYL